MGSGQRKRCKLTPPLGPRLRQVELGSIAPALHLGERPPQANRRVATDGISLLFLRLLVHLLSRPTPLHLRCRRQTAYLR